MTPVEPHTPVVGVAVTDAEDHIRVWSRSAEELFGYAFTEVLGREPAMLFDQWPPASGRLLARRKNGTTFEAQIEIDAGDERLSIITVHVVSEEEVSESGKRVAVLGRVAATMAHEFNNVMMGIGTFVEVLKRRKGQESVDRAVHGIEGSIKRARTITDEILRYTRASKPVKAAIDVAAWLADFTAEAQAITGGATAIRAEPGLAIRGDVSQLNQVLVNLLINSRDAAAHKSPIGIEASRESSGSFVEIVVADRGSGIPPEVLEHIFDPLFTTKPSGTGLGLAVVHQVVTAHGGSIRVQSEVGVGTEFHLLLPAAVPPPEPPPRIGGSLLLVEDDAGVAAGLSAILGSEGLNVRVATKGSDAIREIEQARPDVMVLDLELPDIAGSTVYDIVAERWPGLPVIFISGAIDPSVIAGHLQQPHAAFLHKPFEIDQLLGAVKRVLQSR
jgi:PAS domain S-box-containing protein